MLGTNFPQRYHFFLSVQYVWFHVGSSNKYKSTSTCDFLPLFWEVRDISVRNTIISSIYGDGWGTGCNRIVTSLSSSCNNFR